MKGTWKGSYRFDNAAVQKAVGFKQTSFTINVDSFDGKHFQGTVQDDVQTGGMEEEGIIEGMIENGEIRFQKRMPRQRLIDLQGKHSSTDKKHPVLYYSGSIDEATAEIRGVWKFRYKLGFLFWIIPVPYRPAKGTWRMQKES